MIKLSKGQEKYTRNVRRLLHTAAIKNYLLGSNSKILDFGCKKGEHVCALRDMGLDAYGFDMHDYSESIKPEYRKYFYFAQNPNKDKSDYTMDWSKYSLPFADGEFDMVYSTSVLEHVKNHDVVFQEIYRILKTPGVSIHRYKPRYSLLDGHSFVPLGSIFHNYYYYYFWAFCGIRNRHQKGKRPGEVARLNAQTARLSLNYLGPRTMLKAATKYFQSAYFVPWEWNYRRSFLALCLRTSLMRKIYSHTQMSVLFLEKLPK